VLRGPSEGATYQATTKEHDGNGDMLEILRVPCLTICAKTLKEDIA
jgi:hypothetical protein